MSIPKWQGKCAVVRASSVTDAPTTGYRYPVSLEGADIKGKARFLRRAPGIVPDTDQMIPAGFDYDWSIAGISPDAGIAGYITALAFGSHSYSGGEITITPANDLQWLNMLKDDGLDRGTNQPTERLIGAKVDEWSFECKDGELAKMSIGGVGCNLGAIAATLTPSIPTGANNAPLSWEGIRTAAGGYLYVAYNGAAPTVTDPDINGISFRLSRPSRTAGRTQGNSQPVQIHHGTRTLVCELTKEFSGANARSQYDAWKAQQIFGVQVKIMAGAYYLIIGPVYGRVIDSLPEPVSGESEEPIMGAVAIECFKYGGVALITAVVADGSVATYW